MAGYRIDEQHEVPSIEKPALDTIEIDATRQSDFVKEVLEMPVEEIEPVFVDAAKDYQIVDYHEGAKLYYSQNPINDLFVFTISVDVGSRHNDKHGYRRATARQVRHVKIQQRRPEEGVV